MASPRVLAIQHGPQGGPRRVGDWLTDAGVEVEVIHGYEGQAVPTETGAYAGVLVLGGGYLPDDDHRAAWLPSTRALVRSALDRQVPVLGICLGGQLLAQVGGGTVAAEHGTPEFGSTELTLRPEAGDDPLFYGLPETVPAIERHVDAITALPPGAQWLATSENCCHQAFRLGACAWGVQFHPEVPAARLAEWDPEPLRERGVDLEALHQAAVAAEPAAEAAWRTVTRRFAHVVRQGLRAA